MDPQAERHDEADEPADSGWNHCRRGHWLQVAILAGGSGRHLGTARQFHLLWGGKTIVGGLLGGLIGVELTKRLVRWKHSTGDDFVYPLMLGLGLGRIGCFLTGLDDHTYGTPTTWFTGVNFGDGVYRHPTQLYEILFLIVLALLASAVPPKPGQIHSRGLRVRADVSMVYGRVSAVPPGDRLDQADAASLPGTEQYSISLHRGPHLLCVADRRQK